MRRDKPSDYFVIIPPVVLNDKKLTLGQKVVFGRVFGLTKSKGYCYASNDFMADSLGISKNTIKKYLQKLYKLDYLRYEMIYDKKTKQIVERRIYVNLLGVGDYSTRGRGKGRIPEYPSSINKENKEEYVDKDKSEEGLTKVGDTLKDLGLKK